VRLLVCAGGTGGGVYPALSVLQVLGSEAEVLWVGGEGGMEAELVKRAGIPFRTIPAAGVHGVGLRRLPGNLLRLSRGYLAARQILRSFRPDVLFFTGGYVAVPVGLAGRRIPTVLYVPDIEPGLALKTLARFADKIAVTAEDSRRFFPDPRKVVVTGYPVRATLARWKRPEAREALDLPQDVFVLLAFGGSKGARSINFALLDALDALLPHMHILHITGKLDWERVQAAAQSLPERMRVRYHPFPYLHERMGAALAAADLVVSRAGASVLGEFPLFGLPAILVPYPHAWRYQQVNAAYLADRGAAEILEDARLADKLAERVLALARDEARRTKMAQAMRSLALPDAAQRIAEVLRRTATEVRQ